MASALLDVIGRDPLIGLYLVVAASVAVWLLGVFVNEVMWKPWKLSRQQRDIDAIKRELAVVGRDVAEQRRTVRRFNGKARVG